MSADAFRALNTEADHYLLSDARRTKFVKRLKTADGGHQMDLGEASIWSLEHRLVLAVLSQAAWDYYREVERVVSGRRSENRSLYAQKVNRHGQKNLMREIQQWATSEVRKSGETCFHFLDVCEILNLDPDETRVLLLSGDLGRMLEKCRLVMMGNSTRESDGEGDRSDSGDAEGDRPGPDTDYQRED